ncbi:MAG: hypothetical protein HY951_19220 [Bacteroidia bacterium]|nr:hypothetical protein [Bacteroidia bacterium]
MKIAIFILLLAINFVGFTQNPAKLKRTEIIVNNQDSTVKAIIRLKNVKFKPKDIFVYYWYNSDKIDKNAGGYYGKLLDGKYCVFDRDKNLITQGYFKKGLKNGEWKKWNAKGGLRLIENMKNGLRNGKVISINETGKIITTINYRKGMKNGKCTIVCPDSTIIKKYKKDKEIIKEPKIIPVKAVDEKATKEKKEKVKKEKPDNNKEKKDEKKIKEKDNKTDKKPFWKKKNKDNTSEKANNTNVNSVLDH